MTQQPISPLSGHPHTALKTNSGGRLHFTIRPCELTPLRAKTADGISRTLSVVLIFVCITTILNARNPVFTDRPLLTLGILFLAVVPIGWKVIGLVFRQVFKVTTVIVLDVDAVRVRRGLWLRSYDRNLEHRFALAPHDGAKREKEENEYQVRQAAAKGRVIRAPEYYGESFHVVLVYAGHRVDLLSVYGPKQAASIVSRLQYCDRRLDEAAKKDGGGANPHVDQEWHNAPGGLDDV